MSHDLGGVAYVYRLEGHMSRLGRDCLCLPIGRTRVTTWVGLPILTHWKGTSYDSILVIIGRLTKMIHQLRFDSRHRRLAYKDDTPVTIRSLSSSTSFRRCYATSWCRYRLMHPGFSTRSSATQDSVFTSKSWSPRYHFQARLRLPPTCLLRGH